MSVELDPSSTLEFQRPLSEGVVKTILRLTNKEAAPVVFKIKTTAPKQYCVRPNTDVVRPGETKEVQEPPADYRCKDKFLVQSFAVETSVLNELEASIETSEMWSAAEARRLGGVQEKKLRVGYIGDVSFASEPAVPATPNQPLSNNTVAVPDKATQELKDENKRLQSLCEKYQRELMTTRAELRQRHVATTANTASSESSSSAKSGKTDHAVQKDQYSLPVLVVCALLAFLFGVFFF